MTMVGQVMRRAVTAVPPGACTAEAVARIGRARTHYLLVVDRGELAGILCSCDLERTERSVPVRSYMSRPVLSAPASTEVGKAGALMRQSGFGCLPVVDDGRVVGLLERADLRKAGLAFEAVSRHPPCAACGSDQHVRSWNELEDLGFCFDCLERAGRPASEDELGGSG